MSADCVPCGMEDAEDSAVVFRDDLWACEVIPGFDVPGWYVLRVRRHAERLGGLSEQELATYGRRARDVVDAVGEVTGAPATYLLTFGEANPHFHTLIAARGDDVPPERRLGAILQQRSDKLDRAAALAMVPAMAQAYARLAAAPMSPPEAGPPPAAAGSVSPPAAGSVSGLEAGLLPAAGSVSGPVSGLAAEAVSAAGSLSLSEARSLPAAGSVSPPVAGSVSGLAAGAAAGPVSLPAGS